MRRCASRCAGPSGGRTRAGTADGVGRLFHCVWQGRLPYRLDFELLTTRMEPPTVVEGEVVGDLEGFGRCAFARREWHVRTTRRAGEGLAGLLGARLLAVEHGAPDGGTFMAHSLRSSPPAPPSGRTVRR